MKLIEAGVNCSRIAALIWDDIYTYMGTVYLSTYLLLVSWFYLKRHENVMIGDRQ